LIDDAKLIEFESNELFLTSLDELQNIEFVTSSLANSFTNSLANKAFEHRLILKNITNVSVNESFDFIYISTIESRYDDREFRGILVNCDAARRSTAGIEQFTALQRLNDSIQLNKSIVESKIQFGIDSISIMGTIELNISLRQLVFHIVGVNTSFLLCLVDLDRLEVYFNNLINELMQKRLIIIILQTDMKNVNRFSIIRRYEHAFLLWKIATQYQFLIVEFLDENFCYLTEIELRRLHRRFGHSSARRLHQILERAKHDVDHHFIEHFIKFCHHCQMHGKFFGRFTFSIRDQDIEFNYSIVIEILYMKHKSDNKSVLHIVNEAIRFQAGR
jgi:hypothetical protein